MKLFTKTLLFFASAIVFQSALTIVAITSVTKRLNSADARRELEEESSVLAEKLNAWKRQIWIDLNSLSQDPLLVRGDDSGAAGRLKELGPLTKVDAVALRLPSAPAPLVEGEGGLGAPIPDGLRALRPHPYLDFMFVGETLCLVGLTALRAGAEPARELYLAKRLDDEFAAQLVLDRDSDAALYLGTRRLVGSTVAMPPPGLFEDSAPQGTDGERFARRAGTDSYNVSWRRIGSVESGGELYLVTLLSGAPYFERLVLLDRAVLASSAVGALLTVLFSLYLSRNITHPFAHLLEGMSQLRSGAWDTRVRIYGGREIRELFSAFNEMAHELERHRTALHESLDETTLLKEYNETIVNSIQAGIAIVGPSLVVDRANACFDASLGLASSAGTRLDELGVDLFDETVLAAIGNVLAARTSWSAVKRSTNGRVIELKLYPFAESAGANTGHARCVLVTEDITARTELEEKMLRTEKLASVSLLSAGMAHEINNPLGSILANVQNLIDEEQEPSRRVSLQWIEKETHRIARVVRELLRFASSSGAPQPSGTDVNAVVEEVVRMLSHTLMAGDRIRLIPHLDRGLPKAEPSEDEITQILLNLLTNAAQAIRGPGRIVLTTRLSDSGNLIHLSVADTGTGIPPENLKRIFDPFFTTKPNGEGTGLGLSVVYGIVKKYNGTLRVRSTVGRGTGMRLGLPVRGAS